MHLLGSKYHVNKSCPSADDDDDSDGYLTSLWRRQDSTQHPTKTPSEVVFDGAGGFCTQCCNLDFSRITAPVIICIECRKKSFYVRLDDSVVRRKVKNLHTYCEHGLVALNYCCQDCMNHPKFEPVCALCQLQREREARAKAELAIAREREARTKAELSVARAQVVIEEGNARSCFCYFQFQKGGCNRRAWCRYWHVYACNTDMCVASSFADLVCPYLHASKKHRVCTHRLSSHGGEYNENTCRYFHVSEQRRCNVCAASFFPIHDKQCECVDCIWTLRASQEPVRIDCSNIK